MHGSPALSAVLIDDLEARITQIAKDLRRSGADHPYIPILMTAPGFGWITSFTVACEIAEISRFLPGEAHRLHRPVRARRTIRPHRPARPALQARALVSALGADGGRDRRFLAPLYRERYQRTRRRLGRQRGPKVAQIDLARQLTEAICTC